MKKILLFNLFFFVVVANSQSVIQSVNSGSLIAVNSAISIGEIVINPVSQNQSSTGIIAILTQLNQQTLEVNEFDVSNDIIAYPNPTSATLSFVTQKNIVNEKVRVYDNTGKLIIERKLDSNNSIDLNEIANGIYLIQFENPLLQSFKVIKK